MLEIRNQSLRDGISLYEVSTEEQLCLSSYSSDKVVENILRRDITCEKIQKRVFLMT